MKKIIYLIFATSIVYSQAELIPLKHKIYDFLKLSQLKGYIENYNSANLPLSRKQAAEFINQINLVQDKLNNTEKSFLNDLMIEFEYDINKTVSKSFSLSDSFDILNLLNNKEQKYLYMFTDENASMFVDALGSLSFRKFNTESFNSTSIAVGELGLRMRGTLYDNIGYYLRMSTGQQIRGDRYARQIAYNYDSKLRAAKNFIGQKYYDSYEGYLRFQSENDAFAFTIGRENLLFGTGYIDKLFLSNYSAPFDFAKIDLKYKGIHYSFFYGNVRGDSLGKPLQSKNIISHRLDFRFSEILKIGLFESVVATNRPISFTYMNPLSFLTSADFTAEKDWETNTLMGIDLELKPVRNFGIQLSFLMDDLNFQTLNREDTKGNDNKFGYQAGVIYAEPLGINNLTLAAEYTRLDPFIYSHRTNKSTYTHWGLSLAHSLPPNSDEIAVSLRYYITNRFTALVLYKKQRSGAGFVFDESGKLISNYGGDINRGEGDFLQVNKFLMGNRVDRNIISATIRFEPILQYFIDFNYSINMINNIYSSQKNNDQFISITISTGF